MPSTFIRDKPLQALKLSAVLCSLTFGLTSLLGFLPGQGLNGLLFLAFFPIVLAVIVGTEALLTGYRLARTADRDIRLTTRRLYIVIRAIELIVTVGAPAIFYVLVVRIGGEVPGPGAIGLLFIGTGLGLLAHASVLLRTLVEYQYFRKRSSSSRTDEREENVVE